jgi:uncharacterized membrane protein
MIPFFVLLILLVVFRTLGLAGITIFADWQHSIRFALAGMLLLTASGHLGKRRADLVRMVPPAFAQPGFPPPEILVTLTGIAELAGAAGLLFERTATLASICLMIFLLGVFPANVYAARHSLTIGGRPVPGIVTRSALQFVFLLAVFLAGFKVL